ncbi:MAG: site-specific integrase [Azospirillaceae bacterium]|nr:site-specific integrase [Azospirillaceae bacterium]
MILVDRDGMPPFWPNVYAMNEYRNAGKSPNTTVKVLRTLGLLRTWANALGRDVDHDLTVGQFLSVEDVESLASFLGLPAREQEEWAEQQRRPIKKSNVVRLESYRPDPKDLADVEGVVINTFEVATRIKWVAAYIEWHYARRLGSLDRHNAAAKTLKDVGQIVIERLRRLAPRVDSAHDDEVSLEGVDRATTDLIEEALRPGSSSNPFTPGFVQARNYLIWRFLSDTGARRGEVREALVSNVDYAERQFTIHISKTIPRTVPIRRVTAEAFDFFIENYWSKLPKEARRRGHLFTDKQGVQLSLKAFNRLFERVRESVAGVPTFMAPHSVRRTWNDRFSEMIDAMPPEKRPSPAQEMAMRNRLQGWVPTSLMGARYARRHIKLAADKIVEAMFADTPIPPKRTKNKSSGDNK